MTGVLHRLTHTFNITENLTPDLTKQNTFIEVNDNEFVYRAVWACYVWRVRCEMIQQAEQSPNINTVNVPSDDIHSETPDGFIYGKINKCRSNEINK